MRRALSVCLALAVVLAVLPLGAVGVRAAQSGNYTYSVTNNQATITRVSTTISGDVVIPSSLGGYPVTAINNQAFYRCSKLETVVIPEGVTAIGHQAFYYCRALVGVSLPDSLTTIGYEAFYRCQNLTTVTLPVGVSTLGTNVFLYCNKLAEINVEAENQVFSSSDGVLFSKDGTVLLAYPEGKLDKTYTVPNGVARLEDESFYRCTALTTLLLPDGLTAIGKGTFLDCIALTSVTIPATVTSIGDKAFRKCESLTAIHVAANNQAYASHNGVLFNKDGTVLIQYPQGNAATSYTVPSGVTAIGNGAFSECAALADVRLSNTVTAIGDEAFDGCIGLERAIITDNVATIGYEGFASCTKLSALTLPSGLTEIGDAVFYGCVSLTAVYYRGSETQRTALAVGELNDELLAAAWHVDACINTAEHTYDDEQDVDCALCGAVRTTHLPGDINGDGTVDNRDATRLIRYINEWDVEVVEAAVDINGDGTVDNRDATRLIRYVNEWDVVIR